jgi:4-diphosphocytidyl-2-C-methyl-D-erythritol kinase
LPTITVPSYAKLNLFLRVEGVRPDGYHDITTVFERISLHDTVSVSSAKDGCIRLRCSDPSIPADERNLCWRAAQALKGRCKVAAGCSIRLTKRIPAGSGMGGGSSNAAATLLALCRLWRIRPSSRALQQIAAGLGSDVPFFLTGASFALGRGRGERLRIFPGGPRLYHVIIVPPVHVSTPEIYARWDVESSRRAELTSPAGGATMIFSALKKRDLRALGGALGNDLERVAGKAYPAVREVKKRLSQEQDVAGALMTGSGSAVFGVFPSRKAAMSCCRRRVPAGSRVFYAETR